MRPKAIRRDADLYDTLPEAVVRMWERHAGDWRDYYCVQHGHRIAVTRNAKQKIGRVMCSTVKKGCVS